jgi:hypothetical protein
LRAPRVAGFAPQVSSIAMEQRANPPGATNSPFDSCERGLWPELALRPIHPPTAILYRFSPGTRAGETASRSEPKRAESKELRIRTVEVRGRRRCGELLDAVEERAGRYPVASSFPEGQDPVPAGPSRDACIGCTWRPAPSSIVPSFFDSSEVSTHSSSVGCPHVGHGCSGSIAANGGQGGAP